MGFEQSVLPTQEPQPEAERLSSQLRELVQGQNPDHDAAVLNELETALSQQGFSLAPESAVAEVLYDNTLLCRSENFSHVIDLLTTNKSIELKNTNSQANMCTMASGEGFKTAMVEGFSGKDVEGAVKTVIVFSGSHLVAREHIPLDDQLWEAKPNTAKVSLAGRGTIAREDIVMVSFRFPIHLFPERLLTDSELELLEEQKIKFIVRHYVGQKNRATH